YTVTVTDGNNCTKTATAIITDQSGPTINGITATNVSCNGGNDGSISITTIGGTLPITYNWSNGASTQSINTLTGGTYTITISDANNCTATATATVTEPAGITANTTTTASACGQSNGSVSITAGGGTGTLTYSWNTGATTTTVTGLSAGTYTVTVTDANSCTISSIANINNLNGPSISNVTPSNILCYGGNNGTITLDVTGGVQPLQFTWSNGATTQNINSLVAGLYILTVIDSVNCQSSITQLITQPDSIQVTSSVINATCSSNNGSIDAFASDGSGGFVFLWNTGSTNSSLSALAAGTYTVTVTDVNSCAKITSFIVNDESGPVISNITATDLTCNGSNSGSIDITLAGGTPPLQFNWSNGATSQNINALLSGTYTLTITDTNGCSTTISQFINQPSLITVSTSSTPAIGGQNNGTASVVASGGTGLLTYLWSTSETTSNISGLVPGIYIVTVTDINNCTATASQEVLSQSCPDIIGISYGDVTCNSGNDGFINITDTGGLAPLSYLWSNGATTININSLQAGIYSLTITDANNCTDTISQLISEPPAMVVSTGSVDASCGQSNGSVSVTASGGTGILSYLWNTGATTTSINSLPAGTYTVTVTDLNGCTVSDNANIGNINGPVISNVTFTNVSCNGGNDGTISVVVSGGTPPLQFLWSNGASSLNINNLSAGLYTLTVTDDSLCQASVTQVITEPASITANAAATGVTCNLNNGSVTVTASGGTGTLSYLWNTGATTTLVTNLVAGTYTVTVTDVNNCTATATALINNQGGPLITPTPVNVSCAGGNDGAIFISVNGGTSPYQYNWSNGATTQNIAGLIAGIYTLTVTDVNSCTSSITKAINQPAAITMNATGYPSLCIPNNGSAQVSASGGTGVLSYQWNTGATSTTLNNLAAGTYTVTVTDANSCTHIDSITIADEPGPSIVNVLAVNISCFGANDGSIDIIINGGTGTLQYDWSNGSSLQNINNLGQGTYTLTVSDVNSCTTTLSQVITEPNEILASFTTVNSSCGSNNGSATVNASGGTGALNYLWNNGVTTATISNLSAANYTVTITDATNCSKVISTSVNNINGPQVSINSVTDIPCTGGLVGAITITISGGTLPYVFNWSNGETMQDLSNLAAGTYTLTVTDSLGCIATVDTSIIQQPDPVLTFADVNSSCELANGSLTAIVTGAIPTVQYLWSDGSTNDSIVNLNAGTYTLTVTDGGNCVVTGTTAITTTPAVNIALGFITDVACFNDSTGSIDIAVTGGGFFTYNWSSGQTTQDLSSVIAGTYTVTATNNFGCTDTELYIINQPTALLISVNTINGTCGNTFGSLEAIAAGGAGSYSYLWSDGKTTALNDSLISGAYTVTVTDINNCSLSSSASLQIFAPPIITVDSIVNVTCFGDSTGSIEVSVTGGITPFTYTWSNGATTDDLFNIQATIYTLIVTDSIGCSDTIAVTVSEPSALNIIFSDSDAQCGLLNGYIVAAANGGVAPYIYQWSNGASTDSITNLSGGTYTVTVTDSVGCILVQSDSIVNTGLLSLITDSVNDVTCNGLSDGSIYITVATGFAPLQYNWSNGATIEDISGLVTDTYIVTVTDVYGCTGQDTVFVSEPQLLIVSINSVNPACFNNNGIVTANPFGGTSPYSYLWSNGFTTATINNLSPGDYTVTVTDTNNCATTDSVQLFTLGIPVINLINSGAVSCNAGSDGFFDINVTGGDGNYIYLWSSGQTTQDAFNLVAGTYTVTVTDGSGCSAVSIYSIGEPGAINISFTAVNPTCSLANGSITANVSGGVGGYSYLWSNGFTTQFISGLAAGSYTVTVTDTNNCVLSLSTILTDLGAVVITTDLQVNVTCGGGSDGLINISASGAGGVYSYLWSNGLTTDDIFNLTTGTYTVSVTDTSGCSATQTYLVDEPLLLSVGITSTDATCNNANGTATASPAGGTLPYSYLWSDGQTNATASGLVALVYTVTVTDGKGCTATNSVIINNLSAAIISLDSANNITCFGSSNGAIYITITGGQLPYNYQWSNGATVEDINGLSAGTYTLTLTDANNCGVIFSQTISEPDSVLTTVSSINASCGFSNGEAIVSVTGGALPYTYLWSAGGQAATQPGVPAGTYTVTVTDNNGCTITASVVVSNPASPIIMNSVITDVTCFGGSDGAVNLDLSSGTAPFNYAWSNSETVEDLDSINSGTYTLTVTDAANCTATASFIVNQSPEIIIITSAQNATCGVSNGAATITNVTGGNAPFTYLWSNGDTNLSISNLPAASYMVTVTDSKQCTKTAVVNVSNLTGPSISLVDSQNVSCYGGSNGSIEINITGGSPPFTIGWTNTSQTTTLINNLAAGLYTATVTDAIGCIGLISVNIDEPDSIKITSTLSFNNPPFNISCYGAKDGNIDLTVSGGTPPFSYLWSNSQTDEDIANLISATYWVEVTDANGCVRIDSITLSQPPYIDANAGSSQLVCGTDSAMLAAVSPTFGTGYWSILLGSGTIADVNSDATEVYGLALGANILQWIVTDGICADTALVTISVTESITAIAGVDRSVCESAFNLSASTPQFGYGYWSTISSAGLLVDTANPTTSVNNLGYGNNIFLWTVVNGTCKDSDEVSIFRDDSLSCLDPIEIPSGFTPNGDGKNDFFVIHNIEDYPQNSLEIYNRWGVKIYSTNNYKNDWNGEGKGGDTLPEGTYFYILNLKSISKTYKGYIDLRR
ncbi:MAG: gliding motility-associated C-terminal domain-containing protein, partial [Bacteroidia bacterium]